MSGIMCQGAGNTASSQGGSGLHTVPAKGLEVNGRCVSMSLTTSQVCFESVDASDLNHVAVRLPLA